MNEKRGFCKYCSAVRYRNDITCRSCGEWTIGIKKKQVNNTATILAKKNTIKYEEQGYEPWYMNY